MINSITFVGERILNRPVQDMCSFDTDKCYVLSFCGCRREFKSLEDLLTDLPGYDPRNQFQTIMHDDQWNIFRSWGSK